MNSIFAGLDWASQTHAVCVIDERGAVCKQWEVAHDADGLRELLRQLRALHVLRIAIERPSGLLVDALVEAGFEVVPIHPNAVKAIRPRDRSHAGKSDASAAYLLPALLRTLTLAAALLPAAHRRPPLQTAGRAVRRDPRVACLGARP